MAVQHYFGNQSFKKKREKAEKSGAALILLVQQTPDSQQTTLSFQWRDAERKFRQTNTDMAGLAALCDNTELAALQAKLEAAAQ